ncbi:hypothetical protein BC833DRAFT_631797 [Globomyces pollinis-pini]|nr:hypothetical protein BC833DRAFT_631797 [Globomyces pollinis-pini]
MVSFTNLLLLSATALAMPAMPAKPQVCTPVLRDHQTTGLGSKAVETINQVILPAFRKRLVTNGVAWVLSYQSNTKNKVEQTELVRAVAHLTAWWESKLMEVIENVCPSSKLGNTFYDCLELKVKATSRKKSYRHLERKHQIAIYLKKGH